MLKLPGATYNPVVYVLNGNEKNNNIVDCKSDEVVKTGIYGTNN